MWKSSFASKISNRLRLSQEWEVRQIIWLHLEDPEHHELQSWLQLFEFVKERLQEDCMNYIFIDEVQNIPAFQKAVDGLFIRKNCDVYVTGSNAFILSGVA